MGGSQEGLAENGSTPASRSLGEPVQWFAAVLLVATVGLGALVIHLHTNLGGPPLLIALLAALAMCAEKQPVRVSTNLEMTVAVLPVLFAAVMFGPLAAMIIAAIGLLADFRTPHIRWLIWTCIRALAGGSAGLVASVILADATSFERYVAAAALATFTEACVDLTLGALTVSLRGSGSASDFIRSMAPILLATVPLYTPVILLLVYVYNVSPFGLFVFFAPAFAAHRLYGLYKQERKASADLKYVNARLEKANLSFAGALVAALDARDRYTAGHSVAVAIYARDIARRLGLSNHDQRLAHLAGLLHDIGKVGLPAGILEKAGGLTLAERRQMEEHSVIGERILQNVQDYSEIATIVRHHHERFDGNGYPDGLHGSSIPLIARIIGVADAYNAMTSGRPYRDAMPSRVARLRLAQAVETQFDTTIVAAFEAILAGSSALYLSGEREDFVLDRGDQDRHRDRSAA